MKINKEKGIEGRLNNETNPKLTSLNTFNGKKNETKKRNVYMLFTKKEMKIHKSRCTDV